MTGLVQTFSEATRSWYSSPLIVSRDSIRPELAFSQAEHSLPYSDVTIYIFCNIIFIIYALRVSIYDLSAWGGCLFVVYIRRFIYKFLNVCPFDYTAVAGSGKVGPVNQVNHTSWVAVVTPTDRPKSVRNRCLIELFVALFVLSLCPFDISVGVGAFVIGLSQISFLSLFLCFWNFLCILGHRTQSDRFLFSLWYNNSDT